MVAALFFFFSVFFRSLSQSNSDCVVRSTLNCMGYIQSNIPHESKNTLDFIQFNSTQHRHTQKSMFFSLLLYHSPLPSAFHTTFFLHLSLSRITLLSIVSTNYVSNSMIATPDNVFTCFFVFSRRLLIKQLSFFVVVVVVVEIVLNCCTVWHDTTENKKCLYAHKVLYCLIVLQSVGTLFILLLFISFYSYLRPYFTASPSQYSHCISPCVRILCIAHSANKMYV